MGTGQDKTLAVEESVSCLFMRIGLTYGGSPVARIWIAGHVLTTPSTVPLSNTIDLFYRFCNSDTSGYLGNRHLLLP